MNPARSRPIAVFLCLLAALGCAGAVLLYLFDHAFIAAGVSALSVFAWLALAQIISYFSRIAEATESANDNDQLILRELRTLNLHLESAADRVEVERIAAEARARVGTKPPFGS